MERPLLVAISNDPEALHGVKFVSSFFSDLSRMKVTLFTSLPGSPITHDAFQSFATPEEILSMRASLYSSFTEAQQAARSILERAGMPPENIAVKSEPCLHSTDFHLALEGEVGLYDALVLGRRGIESISQLFDTSIAERLFRANLKLPCWACRRHDPDRKNILMCLEMSLDYSQLVKHVIDFCDLAPKQSITLFHVLAPGRTKETASRMLNKVYEMLRNGGVPQERIQVAFGTGGSAAKIILKEALAGHYAVVAIGKQDKQESSLRRIFSSSTSRSLVRDLNGAALWFTN